MNSLTKHRWILPALLAALVFAGPLAAQDNGRRQTLAQRQGVELLRGMQAVFRQVSADVLPTVVQIDVVDVVRRPVPNLNGPFQFFFGPRGGDPQQSQPQEREFRRPGLGSGVIVRKTGDKVYVLTNNHVAGDADEINVKLNDGRQFSARLVGKDQRKDLALVVFETRENVPVARLGDSGQLQVGDLVLAVGNPLGFASTVTMGIVSATGREPAPGSDVGGFTDYIQTDAAINRGNSGGALVNIDGEVIGINTWIASNSGGSIGLGFAIPINNARQAIDDLITKGKVEYGWLGINVGDLNSELARELDVGSSTGAFVSSVFKDSPADQAGLLPGDTVTRIDGTDIRNTTHLLQVVGNLTPGALSRFEVIRYGRPQRLQVRIAARPAEQEISNQSSRIWPGMAVRRLTEPMRRQLDLPARTGELAIVSVEQGGAAAVAGFQPGDVIQAINGQEARSLQDFYRLINDRKSKETVFKLFRKGNDLIIGLVR